SRIFRVRGVRWIQGNTSGSVLAANQPDFGRITGAGSLASRSFASKSSAKCNAGTVDAKSVFHHWPGAGAHGSDHYCRTAAAALSAICKRAACRPGFLRQHLSLIPIDGAAPLRGGGLIVS